MKRVVITGAGTINALGHNVPQTLEAMREGRCGIGPLDFPDVDRLAIKIGGQVRDFNADSEFNRQQMSLYDRFTQFTLLAAKEAIGQSGLTFTGDLAATSGVVLGTAGAVSARGMTIIAPSMKREKPRTPLCCSKTDEQRRGQSCVDGI